MKLTFKTAVALKTNPRNVFACQHGQITFDAYSPATPISIFKMTSRVDQKVRTWGKFKVKREDLVYLVDWSENDVILGRKLMKKFAEIGAVEVAEKMTQPAIAAQIKEVV